ncbi:hypothetical protein R1flu_013938 [Riccia fluitans]|uniref:Uncharacterized protein n=1 Tax=Riccia fluitans TaxID=41844 RepID=A0ABD1YET2_9MARC
MAIYLSIRLNREEKRSGSEIPQGNKQRACTVWVATESSTFKREGKYRVLLQYASEILIFLKLPKWWSFIIRNCSARRNREIAELTGQDELKERTAEDNSTVVRQDQPLPLEAVIDSSR